MRAALAEQYTRVRQFSEQLCEPLAVEDYGVQTVVEASPPKWHLTHVSWFYETFPLRPFLPGYSVFHPRFEYLFNSYYEQTGTGFWPRYERGLLARPTVAEVYDYRRHVDAAMMRLDRRVSRRRLADRRVASAPRTQSRAAASGTARHRHQAPLRPQPAAPGLSRRSARGCAKHASTAPVARLRGRSDRGRCRGKRVARVLGPGGRLLIGVDLKKGARGAGGGLQRRPGRDRGLQSHL
ncbi:MAG: hypothetical protein ACUVQI_08890 [Thermochromatium sp.]